MDKSSSKLSGWGNAIKYSTKVITPDRSSISEKSKTPSIARGLGRSYGDCSINGELVYSTKKLNKVISFDKEKGIIEVELDYHSKPFLKLLFLQGGSYQ